MIARTPAALRKRALDAELADVAAANRAGVKILAGTDMPSPCEAPLASLQAQRRSEPHDMYFNALRKTRAGGML